MTFLEYKETSHLLSLAIQELNMLWYWTTALALSASAVAHATHHVHDQKTFSQERLDELERKWGTDVSKN